MSSNSFGRHFRISSFGESHGPGVGALVDGVPARVTLDLAAVQRDLERRRPGQSGLVSPRREPDRVQVLGGLCDGVTTGAPLCLWIPNEDVASEDYEPLRTCYRPGHADQALAAKYGIREWRGGGRASGRETVARVAGGAVAKQLLAPFGVRLLGHVVAVGAVRATRFEPDEVERNPLRCADPEAAARMIALIEQARADGDSVGGVVEVRCTGVPAGWGDPVFEKLDARLAGALMGIGAVKGVEIGDGFELARMRGSEANDALAPGAPTSNHAGGILGGIATGAEIVARLAVKPTPSIARPQRTVDEAGVEQELRCAGRHDPCIAPRLVAVAEAMVALVLVDACLAHRALADWPGAAARRGAGQP